MSISNKVSVAGAWWPPTVNISRSNMTVSGDTVQANVDLLAVSCRLYRLHGDEPVFRFTDLGRAARGIQLEPIDHDTAEEVCQHFGKQIVLAQLRGEVTDFQRAVAEFIQSDRHTYTGNVGLIYRLPEYYEGDRQLLAMRDEHFANHDFVTVVDKVSIRELWPIKSLTRNTRHSKFVQYWFTDMTTGNPVRLDLDASNKLRYLWEHYFDSGKTVPVDGHFVKCRHTLGFDFMNSKNWKLEINSL